MSSISPKSGTLSTIVRSYKSAVSKHAHRLGFDFAWQRNYHEHIIRDCNEHARIAEYIENNPIIWQTDKFYQ
jgi:REP element-mobilizing transposase RayT